MTNFMEKLFGPKKKTEKESSKEGSKDESKFEELRAALPENLRDEFQNLSNDLKKFQSFYGGFEMGENTLISHDDLSEEDKAKLDRYDELSKIAKDIIKKRKQAA